MKGMLVVLAVLASTTLTGCGGSSDQTTAAAKCLKNALYEDALNQNNGNCADTTASQAFGHAVSINVTCTHQNGNQYICDAKVNDDLTNGLPASANANGLPASGSHFYNVTYDGKSIVYQPTQ